MRNLAGILGASCVLWSSLPCWAAPVKVLDGTKISVELAEEISSNRSKVGEDVIFRVRENVLVNDQVVVRANARAEGKILAAKGAGGLGRKGKLEFTLEKVEAVDGTMLPLRSTQVSSGKSGKGAMLAVTLLVSPLGLFMKGKNVKHAKGAPFEAFTDKTLEVDPDKAVEAKTDDAKAGNETDNADAAVVADITPPEDSRAHKITLKSGREEIGVITKIDSKIVTMSGEIGVLKIPLANIKSVAPQDEGAPQEMQVVLKSGTEATGKLVSFANGTWKVETNDGAVQIKAANLVSMTMEGGTKELK